MKYYKIVNPDGHYGMIYKEGLNVDIHPFNPSGYCQAGGIYFSREDIFAFLDLGTELYEVEPIGEIYEEPSSLKKWKAHAVNLKYIGKVVDNIRFLVDNGADIHVNNDCVLRYAAKNGHLKVVKYLVEQGLDINDSNNNTLQGAAYYGHLEVVKYLVEQGANIHADNDIALQCAAQKGYLDVVKYLVEQGANIHSRKNHSVYLAAENGHLDVVKYLVKNGADVHADYDYILYWTKRNCHFNVVKYLKSLK